MGDGVRTVYLVGDKAEAAAAAVASAAPVPAARATTITIRAAPSNPSAATTTTGGGSEPSLSVELSPRLYVAAAARGSDALCAVQDTLTPQDYFQIRHGKASGDTRTVSERHLSFLMRQWEVAVAEQAATGPGRVYASNEALRNPIVARRPQAYLLGLAVLVFGLVYGLLVGLAGGAAVVIEAAIVASFVAHLTLWLFVFGSSSFARYRSWSIVDGWNTFTRMTLKVGIEEEDNNFADSNMPSSISSSVATRGSTLNKLMIGVAYSLAFGLFIKYAQLHTASGYLTACGYVLIVATALYENMQYDMDDVKRRNPQAGAPDLAMPLRDHRDGYVQLLRADRPRISIDDKVPITSPTFEYMHALGVMGYIVVSFIGHAIRRYHDSAPLVQHQELAFSLSLAGLLFGLVFVAFNADLARGASSCTGRSSTRTRNRAKGLLCIGIELTALALSTAAGIAYNHHFARSF